MGFIGSILGSVIQADSQKATNSANLEAVRSTNDANLRNAYAFNVSQEKIAQEANEWNYRMFNEQNQWNLDQWNRENEFNSPKQQVQRYIEAGINPLWAIGNGNPGNAQQLTSAGVSPAVVPDQKLATMQAGRIDPINLNGLIAASDSVINGVQGFQKLAIEKELARSQIKKQEADINLSGKQADYYNSMADSVNLMNDFNSQTFETRVTQVQAQYDKTMSEIKNTDANTENYKTQRALADSQIRYNDALITKSVSDMQVSIQNLRLKARELSIQEKGIENSYNLGAANYSLQVDKARAEFQQKSNEQILDYLKASSSPLFSAKSAVRSLRDTVNGWFGVDSKAQNVLSDLEAAGMVTSDRYFKNPSKSNLDAYLFIYNLTKDIDQIQLPQSVPSSSSTTPSVLNPSDSWQ